MKSKVNPRLPKWSFYGKDLVGLERFPFVRAISFDDAIIKFKAKYYGENCYARVYTSQRVVKYFDFKNNLIGHFTAEQAVDKFRF